MSGFVAFCLTASLPPFHIIVDGGHLYVSKPFCLFLVKPNSQREIKFWWQYKELAYQRNSFFWVSHTNTIVGFNTWSLTINLRFNCLLIVTACFKSQRNESQTKFPGLHIFLVSLSSSLVHRSHMQMQMAPQSSNRRQFWSGNDADLECRRYLCTSQENTRCELQEGVGPRTPRTI